MSTVQKFDRSMVQRFLQTSGLKYLVDSDGDFVAEFGYDPALDCELSFWFIVGGPDHDIYRVAAKSNKRISQSDWARAVMLCNEWNRDRRWPKAYLTIHESGTLPYGDIMLEEQIDLEKGIHQELLDDFSLTVMATANAFWKWAKEQGI